VQIQAAAPRRLEVQPVELEASCNRCGAMRLTTSTPAIDDSDPGEVVKPILHMN
jgi:hypothetical protein